MRSIRSIIALVFFFATIQAAAGTCGPISKDQLQYEINTIQSKIHAAESKIKTVNQKLERTRTNSLAMDLLLIKTDYLRQKATLASENAKIGMTLSYCQLEESIQLFGLLKSQSATPSILR